MSQVTGAIDSPKDIRSVGRTPRGDLRIILRRPMIVTFWSGVKMPVTSMNIDDSMFTWQEEPTADNITGFEVLGLDKDVARTPGIINLYGRLITESEQNEVPFAVRDTRKETQVESKMSFKERIQEIKNNVAARNEGKWEYIPEPEPDINTLAETMQGLAENGKLNQFIKVSMKEAEDPIATGEMISEALELIEAKLSRAQRKKLPKGEFVFPGKAPGSGSYPIPDKAHAQNARARVEQHGSETEKRAVYKKTAKFFKGAKEAEKKAAMKNSKKGC